MKDVLGYYGIPLDLEEKEIKFNWKLVREHDGLTRHSVEDNWMYTK